MTFSSAFFALAFIRRSWFFDLTLPFVLMPFMATALCTCVAMLKQRDGKQRDERS